jgi:hypothetical protein
MVELFFEILGILAKDHQIALTCVIRRIIHAEKFSAQLLYLQWRTTKFYRNGRKGNPTLPLVSLMSARLATKTERFRREIDEKLFDRCCDGRSIEPRCRSTEWHEWFAQNVEQAASSKSPPAIAPSYFMVMVKLAECEILPLVAVTVEVAGWPSTKLCLSL